MAQPKRKISKARKGKRRAHWHLSTPQLTTCKNCNQPIKSHQICKHCGYYNGVQILQVKND